MYIWTHKVPFQWKWCQKHPDNDRTKARFPLVIRFKITIPGYLKLCRAMGNRAGSDQVVLGKKGPFFFTGPGINPFPGQRFGVSLTQLQNFSPTAMNIFAAQFKSIHNGLSFSSHWTSFYKWRIGKYFFYCQAEPSKIWKHFVSKAFIRNSQKRVRGCEFSIQVFLDKGE